MDPLIVPLPFPCQFPHSPPTHPAIASLPPWSPLVPFLSPSCSSTLKSQSHPTRTQKPYHPINTSHLVARHTVAHHKSYFIVAKLFNLANKASLYLLGDRCRRGSHRCFHCRVVLWFWLCRCANGFTTSINPKLQNKNEKTNSL